MSEHDPLIDPFILAYRQGQRDERERIRREVNALMSKARPAWREPLAVTMDMILMDGKQEMAQD